MEEFEKFESQAEEAKESHSPAAFDEEEEWVLEYIEQFGTEPSFF